MIFDLVLRGNGGGGMWVIFEVVFRGNRGGGERFLTWFFRGTRGGGCVSDYWHDFQGERRRGV